MPDGSRGSDWSLCRPIFTFPEGRRCTGTEASGLRAHLRSSAPKFDLQRTFNDLPGAGWHPKSFKGTKGNSYCGAKVGLFTRATRTLGSFVALWPTGLPWRSCGDASEPGVAFEEKLECVNGFGSTVGLRAGMCPKIYGLPKASFGREHCHRGNPKHLMKVDEWVALKSAVEIRSQRSSLETSQTFSPMYVGKRTSFQVQINSKPKPKPRKNSISMAALAVDLVPAGLAPSGTGTRRWRVQSVANRYELTTPEFGWR